VDVNLAGVSQLRSLLPALPAIRAFDRLQLLTLLANLYYVQAWGLLPDSQISDPARFAMIAVSIAGIGAPWMSGLLVLNAGAFALCYLAGSPIASNNQLTGFFVSLVVIAGAIIAARGSVAGDRHERMFAAIAGPGRWLLAVMYFFGIYHKINADFLDPQVSCAVVLYDRLAHGWGAAGWQVGHVGAIWATFVIEAIAMIALFVPRWKRFGMLIGVPFHIIIGWTGYAYYKDFSTIALVMYAMFLPRESVSAAVERFTRLFGSAARAGQCARLLLLALPLVYLVAIGAVTDLSRLRPTHDGFFIAFTVFAVAFYAFIVAFAPARPADGELPLFARPAWLMALPVLFFLNGLSPYLGLKTESSMAMYSNLHTEGGETNHLIAGQLPFAFGYQNDIVRPIASNSPAFDALHVGQGKALVRFEFDRILAQSPDLRVQFEHDGAVRTNDATWRNSYASATLFEKKFLIFKPIDYSRPKVCTH
jgi:hypothetical protein